MSPKRILFVTLFIIPFLFGMEDFNPPPGTQGYAGLPEQQAFTQTYPQHPIVYWNSSEPPALLQTAYYNLQPNMNVSELPSLPPEIVYTGAEIKMPSLVKESSPRLPLLNWFSHIKYVLSNEPNCVKNFKLSDDGSVYFRWPQILEANLDIQDDSGCELSKEKICEVLRYPKAIDRTLSGGYYGKTFLNPQKNSRFYTVSGEGFVVDHTEPQEILFEITCVPLDGRPISDRFASINYNEKANEYTISDPRFMYRGAIYPLGRSSEPVALCQLFGFDVFVSAEYQSTYFKKSVVRLDKVGHGAEVLGSNAGYVKSLTCMNPSQSE